jgi:tetratricopeptide (TPR) repeat protein
MSPEQIDGAVPTAAGDIYALGAVAYEMLTGQKARTGSTPLEVAHHVTTQPPPDLRRAWPDAPPAAAEAIKRTMARDPGRRPALAREFVDELSDALTGQRTGATRPLIDRTVVLSSPEPPPARRRTLPRWTPLLVLLLLAGVAGLAVALGSGGGGSSSTNQTSGHRQGSQSSHRSQTNGAQSTSTPASQTSATTPPATDPSALNDQGKALIDSGRPADAIPVLQEALAAFPADQRSSLVYAYTLFNLADAYLRSGQPDKAIPLLRERLKYNDQTAVVQAELEQAMRQAGQLPAGKHGHGKKKGKGGGG